MIKILLVSSLAVLVSCAAWKERKAEKQAVKAPVEQVEKEAAVVNERPMNEDDMVDIEGVVRLDRPGCPVSIDMTKGDLFMTLYPVNLDRQYVKEGLKIKFNYTPSRAASPESCTADMVVSISDVEIIK